MLASTDLIKVGIASWSLTFEARPSPLGLPELSVFPFPGDLDSNIVYNLHERRTAISDQSNFHRSFPVYHIVGFMVKQAPGLPTRHER